MPLCFVLRPCPRIGLRSEYFGSMAPLITLKCRRAFGVQRIEQCAPGQNPVGRTRTDDLCFKRAIIIAVRTPGRIHFKSSAPELPPDMRLSDQSACLVPICLSYSLFIYFHPDMQGIPDKMASLARFAGGMRADCHPAVPNFLYASHLLSQRAFPQIRKSRAITSRGDGSCSHLKHRSIYCPHKSALIRSDRFTFTPVLTVPDIFPWQNIDLRRVCRILSAKSLYTVH